MTWTKAHLRRLLKEGKIKAIKEVNQPTARARELNRLTAKKPEGLAFIKATLEANHIEYITEHRFDKVRRFRFDIALPDRKLAIEYEGLGFKKTGHTTSEGYTANCDKYNLAALQGWTVYRYSYKNYRSFENDLKRILK